MHHESCRQLLARALPGRAAAALGQAAIAAGIITEGRTRAAGCGSQRLSSSEPQPLWAPRV